MSGRRAKAAAAPRKSELSTDDELHTPLRRSTRQSTVASNVSSDNEFLSANGNGSAVKKRSVGRPKKSKLAEEIDQNIEESQSQSQTDATSQSQTVSDASPKRSRGRPRKEPVESKDTQIDYKVDTSGEYEFGGPIGVTAMMIGFPILMWYMWLGATYYDGHFPLPRDGQSFIEFVKEALHLVYVGAFPHTRAWVIYWTFFVMEGLFYLYMPGVYAEGKPLPQLGGQKLLYYCSGVWSFYSTIVLAGVLHVTGIFRLPTIIDEFGPLMSVAIITGYIVSIIAYFSTIYRGAQHRMTGNFLYDFFMGAELNPRMFKWLDFKMFFEVRIPWFILFFVSLAATVRQYETYGYVSGEMLFVLMAHFLYANACCKGEELITTSWDMYFEKWGFMLIFWNLAGVPLSYCHCTIYLANHHPDEYRWPTWALVLFFTSYLFVYWVWDTCNSQKNMFRQRERGTALDRKTFPQLPWKEIKNPKTIPTKTGDSLLCDGWYGLARKVHYSCDTFFAITWGLITGFNSPFPWFYPIFFTAMIAHRASRDIARCKEKYGEAWEEYTRRVPYLFIPYVF